MVQRDESWRWLLEGFRYELEAQVRPRTVEYYYDHARVFVRWAESTAPYNKTDTLIVAPISNWGAYGLEAAIALLLKRPEIIYNGAMELRVLGQAANAGFIMARWGYTDPGADGLSDKYHSYVVELLRRIVLASI